MPHMTVITTADAIEVKKATDAVLEYDGPVYLRTVRCPVPVIFDEAYDFQIGKAVTLRDGGDLRVRQWLRQLVGRLDPEPGGRYRQDQQECSKGRHRPPSPATGEPARKP